MISIASKRKLDTFILAFASIVVSISSFLHFYSLDKILLYGDAVAHINIARRVFDSQYPGLPQLGTVWLPLPHLLMLPFIVNDRLWSSGIGGSLVSMASYVFGAIGIAFIFWRSGIFGLEDDRAGHWAGWLAALVYLCNPNLLYLQSTAMTEPLGLALMVWALYFYCRFVAEQRTALLETIGEETANRKMRAARRAQILCAFVLAAAMLTRYDYWFLAAAIAAAVLAQLYIRYRGMGLVRYKRDLQLRLRRTFFGFVLILAFVPAFWLAYNKALFGSALEFANGKYSARAIAARSVQAGNPPHPGSGSVKSAGLYFWKAARLDVGSSTAATLVIDIAVIGGVALAFSEFSLALLLWSPLLFYTWSVAYGGIPIFVPEWPPFSYYNVRYGLQLLPAVAISFGFLALVLARRWNSRPLRIIAFASLALVVTATYVETWSSGPACLREAEINSAGRIELHKQLVDELKLLPSNATFVVSLTEHVGAFERAGIPLRRTWNESSHSSGEQEFAFPLTRGDYVIAFDGDTVSKRVALHPEMVKVIATFNVPGEKRCIVYKTVRN